MNDLSYGSNQWGDLIMSLTELTVAVAAELKAVNDLNEKLAARIEALEASAVINAVEWVPDIQWHKDNGYPI
jgi:hypothetical protein